MAREYAYIRVSSKDQNEDRQIAVMQSLGIASGMIFTDKASGKDFARPEYQLLKRVLKRGDTLFVKSLDRFGRNKQEIFQEWQWFIQEGIDIVVIDMPILDTRKYKDAGGVGKLITDLVLQILSWLAEEERITIKQRQAEGIAAAKAKGKHLGRPRKGLESLTKEQKEQFDLLYPKWKATEVTATYFMGQLEINRSAFYKIVKEYEDKIESLLI
ncbi:recombinase family protein [Brevibacillus invocatus]|uniref:recombinase family protein n=1 Tax=Brevibacillus invocatus TaxID=173959 RepID=UPI00203D4F45|nr:recombinase family protein [Brevibacillus invocatus]MCM3079588.1 recombinase family protein [Brevibacillus invocatus]MCM3429786.1 recombinase family protein [Brevibacillus invocatus]